MTEIISNGSKWAGEAPDSIDELRFVLDSHTLDPIFEGCGNFVFEEDGIAHFFGNFYDLSHVFRIATNDRLVIDQLTQDIRRNQNTPEYAIAKRERAENDQYWEQRAKDRQKQAARWRRTA